MSIEDLTGTVVRKICMACSREFHGTGQQCPHDGNMLVPLPQDPYVGRRIAEKYQILSVLGTGGMGVVYLARHETMQCNVAIKMLRAQFVGDHTSVKRFNHEAIAARRLQHPNVISTYDHGFTSQGQPYIVMECLQGVSLADEIKRLKSIGVDRVLHIFMQACDALDHAHKQGIIHRDLKPGNLMLINYNEDKDHVKVVDFGVAKIMPINNEEAQSLTQQGEVCGSPVYMSPEQCLGQPLDRRADVYSMGIVIYEALTGKLPLMGKSMVDTMSKHINQTPPPFKEVRPDLYIPERIEQVVMRALAKDPNNRQQSMALLKQELMLSVPRPGQNPSLRTFSGSSNTGLPAAESEKKSILVPVLAALLLLLLGAGGMYFFFQSQRPPANSAVVNPATPVNTKAPSPSAPAPANTTAATQPVSTVIPPARTTATAPPTSATATAPPTSATATAPPTSTTAIVPPQTSTTAGNEPKLSPLPAHKTAAASALRVSKPKPAAPKRSPSRVATKPAKKSSPASSGGGAELSGNARFESLAKGLSYKKNKQE